MARSGSGFVTALVLPRRNAADSPHFVTMVKEQITNTGVIPSTASADDVLLIPVKGSSSRSARVPQQTSQPAEGNTQPHCSKHRQQHRKDCPNTFSSPYLSVLQPLRKIVPHKFYLKYSAPTFPVDQNHFKKYICCGPGEGRRHGLSDFEVIHVPGCTAKVNVAIAHSRNELESFWSRQPGKTFYYRYRVFRVQVPLTSEAFW